MKNKNEIEKIFCSYDIRGKYPEEINEEIVFEIGRAWAKILKKSKEVRKNVLKNHGAVAVARDMRKGSAQLARALSCGLLSEGLAVDYLGMASSPMLYWSVFKKEYLAGAVITASHNPRGFNGIKFCLNGGEIDIEAIWEIVKKERKNKTANFLNEKKVFQNNLYRKSYIEQYINFIRSFYAKNGRHLKIVIDAAWGMASEEIPFIFNGLNIDFIPICFGPSENFSDKNINPLNKSALDDLSFMVKKYKADLGVAFDGDADRVVFVDEKGDMINPEIITAILSRSILEKNPEAKIVLDIRSGKTAHQAIKNFGGKVIVSKSGHTNIKRVMREKSADFSAETSGHYFFKDAYRCDNAMIAMLKVLNIAAASSRPISEICQELKAVEKISEINFEFSDSSFDVKKRLKKVEAEFKKNYKRAKINWLDGLTMESGEWRFNLRSSNTETGVLRLNLEAQNRLILKEILG
ncbi:MAG: phosphomannomutase/phosphoglucomutase, partial [bacterium]